MAETTFSTPTALEAAGVLAASIAGKRHERLEKRSQEPPWKPRRNYASGLSSCVRQMTYAHTHWDQKEPFGVDGVAHMEDGNHEERLLIQELLTDGFEVVEEQVKLDEQGIASLDWESYPILRFSEAPAVEVSIIDRPDEPSLGVGEAVAGPLAAAIANAVAHATGKRLRDLPLDAGRVKASLG